MPVFHKAVKAYECVACGKMLDKKMMGIFTFRRCTARIHESSKEHVCVLLVGKCGEQLTI